MTAPRLLVSVRSAAEARVAVDAGAGIIDVKEPDRGPLGRAGDGVVASVVAAVAGRVPVSVALGEFADIDGPLCFPPGADFVKVGLADAPADWSRRLASASARAGVAGLIAVAYGGAASPTPREGVLPPLAEVLEWAIGAGAAGLLVDTCDKTAGDLFTRERPSALAPLIARARAAGLTTALAGSLGGLSFDLAIGLGPDIVAVRTAACRGGRTGTVDARLVTSLLDRIGARSAGTTDRAS